MSVDLGSALPDLAVTTLDAAGAPADATTITLTIVQPDGTDITPAVTRLSVGRYVADFVPTMAGLHLVRWVATGAVPAAYRDHHHVASGAAAAVVSVAELSAALRVSAPDLVEALRRLAVVATEACESRTQRVWIRRSFTEQHAPTRPGQPWRRTLHLHRQPVISVSSIADADGALAQGSRWSEILPGVIEVTGSTVGPLTVTYIAGPTDAVPESIREGVRVLVKHLWDLRGTPTRVQADELAYAAGVPDSMPRRVEELWTLPGNADRVWVG